MQSISQTVSFFISFFVSVLVIVCSASLAQQLPEQEIEIFATGKKYASVEEYLRARRKENLKPVVLSDQPLTAASPEKPFIDENGWRTVVVDQKSAEPPAEFVERFVAGIDSFEARTSGGKPVRKVASIQEMNAGLAAEASKTSAPLLILAEGGNVKVLELTRKTQNSNQLQMEPDPLLQGE